MECRAGGSQRRDALDGKRDALDRSPAAAAGRAPEGARTDPRAERSILGIPNPEWCYCSLTAEMERAKPRQQALCPSPTPILRATPASLHARSRGTPDKLSSEMAFFPRNPASG